MSNYHFLPGGPYTFCGFQITARIHGTNDFKSWLAFYREHEHGYCPRCHRALTRFTAYSIPLSQADAWREQEFGPPQPNYRRPTGSR